MRRKFELVVMVIGSVLLLVGCSFKRSGALMTKKTATKTAAKTETVYYQNLTKADKAKVNFKFKLDQDETKDNYADPVYVVSMKVTNRSKKTIKFNRTKFVFILNDDKKLSKKRGVLKVKAGQTESVDQLFTTIPEQSTLGDGIIEYLNKTNKLAYADFKNGVAKSSNLKNKKLIAANKSVSGYSDEETATDSSTDSDDDSSTTTDEASSSETSTGTRGTADSSSSSASSSTGLTEDQAKAALTAAFPDGGDFGGYSMDELKIDQGSTGGWTFVTPEGLCWIVRADGTVKAPGDPQ
ncbi:hypothetical protein C5Z26_04400 [Lactobacillus sp. CBA3606]|uniref:hypothetical protein n=1 Tax=Lactobacillus sp. CBA3606 TaxID=2099789 RepID=UPI000CFC8CB6|nr:hypothetical protein [Lactobacillus sp. CBA3606]AVK63388.1 hypothetical protein C5Z26_04400 [Lactobacillus sp. CBA3606]